MGLDWLPREKELKNHDLHGTQHWGSAAPRIIYEKRPLKDPDGKVADGLFVSWIILDNPKQYNSYNTEMLKDVIADVRGHIREKG